METSRHKQRVRERAYSIWELQGRRHGHELADWLRAEVELPLCVTFDSNVYRQVVNHCRVQRDASLQELQKINDALRSRRLLGFLSQTIVTLEGITNADRVAVLGSTRLESRTESAGKTTINISVIGRQDRKPLNSTIFNWIQAAQEIGLRFLRTGSRWFDGSDRLTGADYMFFEPDENVVQLAERMDKINRVTEAIQARGLGYAVPVSLGLEFSARDGVAGELWLQGLRRARSQSERNKINKAISEWADADSVAAHVGYDIDLFCTHDKGNTAGGPSIFTPDNRAWLTSTYGVEFVTLSELATTIAS